MNCASRTLPMLLGALCAATAGSTYLGCPADHEYSAEAEAAQLELEEYFVGHEKLPFFNPIDDFLDETAGSLGLQSNQFRYILGMLAMYPLAVVHRLLPNIPTLKHTYSLTLGIFISLYCFGINTLVPFATSILIFVLLKGTFGSDTDKKHVTSVWVPVAYFSLMLAILSAIHIHRMTIDYGGFTLDVSGPQMVITIKLCQVVWNVYDFRNPHPKFPHRQKNAIDVRKLSLLSFLAYVFYFPGYLAGPAFEFQRYLKFTELRDDYRLEYRPSLMSSVPASLRKLAVSVSAMLVTVLVANRFSLAYMLCEEYEQLPLLARIAYLHFSVSLLRAKYYVAWYLAEGALTLSGITYDNHRKKFDALDNSRLYHIEFGQSIREAVNNWNINTSKWLRVYVYERAHQANLGTLSATALAFMTSAFWHGFYGGYYVLFFFVGIFIQPLAKELRRHLRPHFEDYESGKTPLWYNVGGIVMTSVAMNFFASSFGLLSLTYTYQIWKSVYFYGLAGLAVIMLVPPIIKALPGHKAKLKQHKQSIKDRFAAKAKAAEKYQAEIDKKLQDAAKAALTAKHTKEQTKEQQEDNKTK